MGLRPICINVFLTNVLFVGNQCFKMTNSAFQGGGRLLYWPTALAIHFILRVFIAKKWMAKAVKWLMVLTGLCKKGSTT